MNHYADHQETAAEHLRSLISSEALPSPTDVDLVLNCRNLLWGSVAERMRALGQPTRLDPTLTNLPLHVSSLHQNSPILLGQVVASRPLLPLEERARPSDVLGTQSRETATQHWAAAASSVMAGTHTLENAEDKPWVTEPGAGWYVLGDTAQTVEALLVLDQDLEEVGLLNTLPPSTSPLELDESRLIARHCAESSTWYATNSIADLAYPAGREPLEDSTRRIRMVKEPADLAAAHRRLGDLTKIVSRNNVSFADEQRLDAATIHAVVSSQMRTVDTLKGLTSGQPALTAHLIETQQMLTTMRDHTSRLFDLPSDRKPTHPAIWQQQEISHSMRRFDPTQLRTLTSLQVRDLVSANHQALSSFARSANRELIREDTHIRRADIGQVVGPTREYHRSPLSKTLMNLRDMESPTPTPVRWPGASSRETLGTILSQIPLTRRAPTPFIRRDPPGYSR